MKNKIKVFGSMRSITIITLVAIIFFSFAACDNETDTDIDNTRTPGMYDFIADGFSTSRNKIVFFDGEAKEVIITAHEGMTTGKITVFYEEENKEEYPKTDAAPVSIGKYNVTFDVEASIGWKEAKGLPAGTLIIADGRPAVPLDINIFATTTTSATIEWKFYNYNLAQGYSDYATTTPKSFNVYYTTEALDEITLAGTVDISAAEKYAGTGLYLDILYTCSYIHTGLTPNSSYYYIITGVNDFGEGVGSGYNLLKTTVPDIPTWGKYSRAYQNSVYINWNSVIGAVGYKIYYSTGSSEEKTLRTTREPEPSQDRGEGFGINFQNATSNTKFNFWITAYNGIGESDFSEVLSLTTGN